ncbi:MAG: protein kinase [Planctomycetales bacterium]|nr:protein kinase [Planctomycetales bacterium]
MTRTSEISEHRRRAMEPHCVRLHGLLGEHSPCPCTSPADCPLFETPTEPADSENQFAPPAGQAVSSNVAFLRELVQRGTLTPLQANALLTGASEPLLIGDYIVLDKFLADQDGVIYKAQSRVADSDPVCVRLLPSGVKRRQTKWLVRLLESRSRWLTHRHLAATRGLDQVRKEVVLLTEFIPGATLAEAVFRNGPVAPSLALQYAMQLGSALKHAADGHLHHGRLTPEMIVLTDTGVLKLYGLDYAVLRRYLPTITLERPPLSELAISCQAPEQRMPNPLDDHRTDIYALGAALFFMMTGRPWNGAMWNAANPQSPLASLPPTVQPLLARMLAFQPTHRYANYGDLLRDLRTTHEAMLEQALDEATNHPRPQPRLALPTPPPRRRFSARAVRLMTILGIGGCLVLAAVIFSVVSGRVDDSDAAGNGGVPVYSGATDSRHSASADVPVYRPAKQASLIPSAASKPTE